MKENGGKAYDNLKKQRSCALLITSAACALWREQHRVACILHSFARASHCALATCAENAV